MEIEKFSFKGKVVKQADLIRIWKRIKQELAGKHSIDNIKMPNIEAMILKHRRFQKALNRFEASPHLYDTSEVEWGAKCKAPPSALTFFADVSKTWIILKCRGYGYPLEVDLKHELLHIWEDALGLKLGTLTSKSTKR